MSTRISNVISPIERTIGGNFSVKSINLHEDLGQRTSALVLMDDFRVRGQPFGPHPHAGFSAISYVLSDSKSRLRSRDSLGNDVLMEPGGIVWLQAGRGAMHEEVAADAGQELHGLQIFVNLSAKNKLISPQTMWLEKRHIPEWRSSNGDQVRVVVGHYKGVASPLTPAEPFDFLDIELQGEISHDLDAGRYALVYVLAGSVIVATSSRTQAVAHGQGVLLSGRGPVTFHPSAPARIIVLSGVEIQEPVLLQGSFIMNNPAQVEAAVTRFNRGEMGRLEPIGPP